MESWMTNHWGVLAVGLVGVVLLNFAGAWLLQRQRAHDWAILARQLHLRFHLDNEGQPHVTGKLDGHAVEIDVPGESSDTDAGIVVTELRVDVAGLPTGMTTEAAPGLIGDLANLAEESFLTGDEQFDRNTHVTGSDPATLSRYWTPARRHAFLKLIEPQDYDQLSLGDGRLTAQIRSALSRRKQLRRLMRRMVQAAGQLASSLERV